MLPPPCHWIHQDAGSYLQWHYGCVSYVTRREGRWRVVLQGWGIRGEHACASREQGVRFIERWVCGRQGLPGFGSKVLARQHAVATAERGRAIDGLLRVATSRKLGPPPTRSACSTVLPPENAEPQVFHWPSESP